MKGEHSSQIGAVLGFLRGLPLPCMLISDHQNHLFTVGEFWLFGGRQDCRPDDLHFFRAVVNSLPNASVAEAERRPLFASLTYRVDARIIVWIARHRNPMNAYFMRQIAFVEPLAGGGQGIEGSSP